MNRNSLVDFEFDEILHETEKALLVGNGYLSYWLPKSMIKDEDHNNNDGTGIFMVPYWLAEAKGIT